ncbi:MAG: hypothetical protein WC489_06230 [Patescibacteria group bacterium]|jgi:hypothetical protein
MATGPSVDRMRKVLKIPLESAKRIKQSMNQGKVTGSLKLANEAMGGFGVESLYPDFPKVYYVNMGDTYSQTLYYTGRSFQIGSWGDWVEQNAPRSFWR